MTQPSQFREATNGQVQSWLGFGLLFAYIPHDSSFKVDLKITTPMFLISARRRGFKKDEKKCQSREQRKKRVQVRQSSATCCCSLGGACRVGNTWPPWQLGWVTKGTMEGRGQNWQHQAAKSVRGDSEKDKTDKEKKMKKEKRSK